MKLDGINGVENSTVIALDFAIEALMERVAAVPEFANVSPEILAAEIQKGITHFQQIMTRTTHVKSYIEGSRAK